MNRSTPSADPRPAAALRTPHALATRALHAGEPSPRVAGAVVPPLFLSSSYGRDGGADSGPRYLRLHNTPTHRALAERIASLESAEDAVVTASGMAALTSTLLALLSSGDRVIAQRRLYGGSVELLTGLLPRLGIACDFVDGDDPASWTGRIRPETRVLLAETIGNPLLDVADLPALAQLARAHGLLSVVDNTFASPALARPVEWGIDLVFHSASKFLNGHTDLVAGAVAGRRDLVERVRSTMAILGGCLDAQGCYLLQRGLKTLVPRMRQQGESAAILAEDLDRHTAVARVLYPGSPSHATHARARRLLDGFGCVVTLDLAGGAEAARRLVERLEIAVEATSLGGVETLVARPAHSSHARLDAEVRRVAGIGDGLVRVSVGLEEVSDLLGDFRRALDAV